jgi:hypothetical protein
MAVNNLNLEAIQDLGNSRAERHPENHHDSASCSIWPQSNSGNAFILDA